jgi:flagellar motor component MotA
MKKNIILILCILLFCGHARSENIIKGLGSTVTDAFDTTGLAILTVGVGATLVRSTLDQSMHDAWVNNQRMSSSISGFGSNFWGTGVPSALIAGAQLVWDEPNGIAHSESLIVSTVLTFGLKYLTARKRPDSDTATSFPSGHSQVAFCTASSLGVSYGLVAAIPSYGLAVLTAMARLADNAHWLSDVVAGATVGILFGRSAFKHNMYVTPVVYDGGGLGINLTYRY